LPAGGARFIAEPVPWRDCCRIKRILSAQTDPNPAAERRGRAPLSHPREFLSARSWKGPGIAAVQQLAR